MGVRKTYNMELAKNVQDIQCRDEVLIVRPILDEEIGGIIIPVSAQEKGQKGWVCKVGPGSKDVNMEVVEGDKVYHVKWAGSEVSIEGEKFLIMKQEDILGRYFGDRPIDITPLEDRIFIEWEFGQEEFKGTNILRPEGSSKERYYTGVVQSIGPKVEEIKVGERIFFNQFCGPERIEFENKRYAMIYEKDAYCVVPLRKNLMVLSH